MEVIIYYLCDRESGKDMIEFQSTSGGMEVREITLQEQEVTDAQFRKASRGEESL